MLIVHYLQFLVYSFCIFLFTVYTYVVYYSDLISLTFRDELLPEYDYIIVGSGTAGSLIAHRLATDTNYTFLVLEAGPSAQNLMHIPIIGPAIHGSMFDWSFKTVKQHRACGAFKDNKCRLAQGKIVGGSSKLNNMVHFKGNISHYVQWFHGKYTEDDIASQFDYIENNALHLNQVLHESEMASAVLEAANELGYMELRKKLGLGFQRSTVSQKNGKRWSTSDNVDSEHILTNALVEKVLFKDHKAFGVQFQILFEKRKVFARKGVILSAGTINSPKILQLSGIGPAKLLKSLRIPVIKDLPVGKNLQDHISTGLDLVLFNQSLSINAGDILNPINSLLYFLNGTGPLTTPGCELLGFVSTKNMATPDLQFMVLPVGISSDRGSSMKNSLGLKDEVWDNYFKKVFDKHTATILPVVLHPESKGTVFINSTDANDPPLLDPKYLLNKNDRKTLINGLNLVLKLLNTEAMKSIGAYVNPYHFPGCEMHTIFTDLYWDCYITQLSLSSYHPVGTCSMGLPGSKTTVVDTNFQILGTNNLYVVDGSVLPTLPSGNINAAIAMMANLFFENNIRKRVSYNHLVCSKYDLIYDVLFYMCLISGVS